MDATRLEQDVKTAVENTLRTAEDFPAGAADILRRIVIDSLRAAPGSLKPRDAVVASSKGVMAAALLLDKDLPLTSLSILRQMGTVADETHHDPSDLMSWAMEGIAPVVTFAGEAARTAVKDAISSEFMGAGEIFSKACETTGA
ncbi:MAG: hypothetical protein AAB036_02365 [Elusimicrobiota bacterium]